VLVLVLVLGLGLGLGLVLVLERDTVWARGMSKAVQGRPPASAALGWAPAFSGCR